MMPMQPKFHLSVMGEFASVAFSECLMFCQSTLERLGYEVTREDNRLMPDAINIVLCAHHSTWKQLSQQASDIIIYNLEPVAPDVSRFRSHYFRQMVSAPVWDYSATNVSKLKAAGVTDIHYVPLGYVPQMTQDLPDVEQDIDVLFYGLLNARRQEVINEIRAKGLRVVATGEAEVGMMVGAERDAYIARAKIVLNLHYFDEARAFELARVSYLLANKKAVVSEVSFDTDIHADIQSAIAHGEKHELAQLCFDLVHDPERRRALEINGFEAFKLHDETQNFNNAIQGYLSKKNESKPTKSLTLPLQMQWGAGDDWRYNLLNVYHRDDFAPDLTIDINHPIPFNQALHSWRFGEVRLEPNYFEKIIARNVFQKVDDLPFALTQCLELLKDGGILELAVPHDLSWEAWKSIDDKRAFHEKTWEWILNDWWQYGWDTHRFELVDTGHGLENEYGMSWLHEHNVDWVCALRMPRVIDTMYVTLRKRVLTDDELKLRPQNKFMG